MKQFLITVAGVFAGLALFFVGLPILLIAVIAGSAKPAAPPARTVLTLDLRKAITDQASQNPLSVFSGSSQSVVSVIQALHRAETDGRVKGLFLDMKQQMNDNVFSTLLDPATTSCLRSLSWWASSSGGGGGEGLDAPERYARTV